MVSIERLLEMPSLYKNWVSVLANRFGLKSLNKLILRNGILFLLKDNGNIETQSRARSIVSHTFGREGYDIFRKISKGDIVIDIGAFIGDFTIKSAKNNAEVYAFEPAKETFDVLVKNISVNKCKENTHVFNKGIFVKKKKAKLHTHEWEGVNSMVECDWLNEESKKVGSEEIELITIKDVFAENKLSHCNFLKIDCEGVESEIVRSIPSSILKKIEYISMESTDYLKSDKNRELISFLENNDFELEIFDESLSMRVRGGNIIRIFAKNKKFKK